MHNWRPVGYLPAWRAGRLVADDRRSGARSAHEVLRHVLPGRLQLNRRITLNPWHPQRLRIGLVRSRAHNFARASTSSQPVPEMTASRRQRRRQRLDRRQQLLEAGTACGTGRPTDSAGNVERAQARTATARAGIAIRVNTTRHRSGQAMPGTTIPTVLPSPARFRALKSVSFPGTAVFRRRTSYHEHGAPVAWRPAADLLAAVHGVEPVAADPGKGAGTNGPRPERERTPLVRPGLRRRLTTDRVEYLVPAPVAVVRPC